MKRLILVILLMLVTVPLQGKTASSTEQVEATSVSASLGITLGVYQPPTFNYGTELNALNALTGKTHGLAMYYLDWSTQFDPFLQNQINSQMALADRPVIMLAWGPAGGVQQYGCDRDYAPAEKIPWSVIIQGGCDMYIRAFASAIKQRPERFLLKFAHEMNNGAWSPVYPNVTPDQYVLMWRHVHDIFTAAGVVNVEWVWAPIYQSDPNVPENSPYHYYPGDDYVDWVGLSGFNYYVQMPVGPQPWLTFDDMFGPGLRELACRYAKPQMIHEMASVDDAQQVYAKGDWIADAYESAQNYPLLRAVVWFNDIDYSHPSVDFRVTSNTAANGDVHALPENSSSWTNAYSAAIASSAFVQDLPVVQALTPPATYCGAGEAVFTVNPNAVLLERGQSSQHTLIGLLYSGTITVTLDLPANITGAITPDQLPAPWGTAHINLQASAAMTLGTYTVMVQAGSVQLPVKISVVDSIQRQYLSLVLR